MRMDESGEKIVAIRTQKGARLAILISEKNGYLRQKLLVETRHFRVIKGVSSSRRSKNYIHNK